MTGREEIDLKNEKWIEEKLNSCPNILKDYMIYIKNKTSWSRRNYLGYLIQFVKYLRENGMNPDDVETYINIKPLDIRKYLDYISYRYKNGVKIENKAGIKAAKLFAVSDLFEFLIDNEYIDRNPCDRIETPKDKEEKQITFLTTDEIKTMQNNITNRGKYRSKKYNTRDLCIITLGVTTGLRVSAIAEINIQDIDFEAGIIKVTEKGNIKRDVLIGEKTKALIKQWINEREVLMRGHENVDALFVSKDKKRISTVSIRNMITKESYNIEKHITPHKMRATCATNLYEATGDIYLVQNQLGHSNIENTRRYARVSDERKAMAAKLLDNMI